MKIAIIDADLIGRKSIDFLIWHVKKYLLIGKKKKKM